MIGTLEERIRTCLGKHPEWTDRHITQAIRGAQIAVISSIRSGNYIPDSPLPDGAGIISLDKIKARYDTVSAIQRELARVQPKNFIHEADLCSLTTGRDRSRFRRCVENNPELFSARRIKVKLSDSDSEGKWIWGSEADILAIKELIER